MALLRPGKCRTGLAIVILLLASFRAAVSEPPDPRGEYAIKSVFLYNFCRFIQWPREAFAGPSDPIVIGVIGEDPFGPLLEEAVLGETLRGRPIRLEYYRRAAEIGRCHILFVSRSETGRTDDIVRAVAGRSIVTVGESEAFLERGGMIALTAEHNRVRLQINPALLRAASLDVSSKLLHVAEIKS